MLNVNHRLLAGGVYQGDRRWNKKATSLDECFKFYSIVDGRAMLFSREESNPLEKGNCYFINGFELDHQCCPVSFQVDWLHFIPESIFLKQFLFKLPVVVRLDPQIPNRYQDVLSSFAEYFNNSSLLRKRKAAEYYIVSLKIQSLLSAMVAELTEKFTRELFSGDITESRLMPAIEYMNASYKKKITLKELAGLCYLSENYFQVLFKKRFGVTPNHYILQLRMNEAIHLLGNTKMTIQEIARETGYWDSAYFSKIFSRYFNQSPGKFRSTSENRIP